MNTDVQQAKKYLGEKWVLHPRYEPEKNPAHRVKFAWHLREHLSKTQQGN